MIVISEWLPNPAGSDAKGEWIEVHNNGNVVASLVGWRLTADGKKFFELRGSISPGGYLLIPRNTSKLSLKNTDGTLALYDSTGRLADHLTFQGAAPEGKSANRAASESAAFAEVTPGTANKSVEVPIHRNAYPTGVPLGLHEPAAMIFTGAILGTALALAVAAVFIIKTHADLSHLFFAGNQDTRRSTG